MEKQILIDAIKANLHYTGNAGLVEVALAALGHVDLGHRIATDMTRLVETIKAADAECDPVEAFMSGDRTPSALDIEVERRQREYWDSVAAVKAALGIEVEE